MTAPAQTSAVDDPFSLEKWSIERDGALVEVVTFIAAGRNRRGNGDACLVSPALGLLAVADGVSTLPNGGPTARRCLKEFALELEGADAWDAGVLRRAIDTVNRRIFAASIAKRSSTPLGACILIGAALWPAGDGLTYFHVGDGALLLRRDANTAFEAVTQPQVVRRDSRLDPNRKIGRLAAAVGVRPTINPDLGECEIGPGGGFILASDGVPDLPSIAAAPWFDGDSDFDAFERLLRAAAETASDDLTVIAGRRRRIG